MDILHIRYFSAVYETLNYAQAAEQLYVSRQALRKVVHTVEREVGQPLFQNVANHLQATPAADRLYQISREAVRGFNALEDGLASMKLSNAGILRIGLSHDCNAVFSRSEREAFTSLPDDRHPVDPARLRYRSGSKDEVSRLLLQGDLDYAHAVGCVFDRRLFDCQVARTGRLHLIVNKADPLASKDSVAIEDLAACKMSLPTEGNDITELLTAQARLHGFELDVVRYDPSLHHRLSDAQTGHAACVGYLDTRYPRIAPDTVSIPFAEEFMAWSYCVLAKKGMGDPLVMRYFAGLEIDWDGYIRSRHALQGRGLPDGATDL